jgi:hypothetical protein
MDSIILLSPERLEKELRNGKDPNEIVIQFSRVRLVHYYAENSKLEHLKILHKYQADFTLQARDGSTVRNIVERNQKKFPQNLDILLWLDSVKL